MCLLGYAVDDAVVELLGMGPVLVVLPEASTSTVCLRWASAGQWMPSLASGAEFSFDPDFGLKKSRNFSFRESLESVDTCLYLTETGAGGSIGDWARDEGVLSNSES